jgi:hypothetical protein
MTTSVEQRVSRSEASELIGRLSDASAPKDVGVIAAELAGAGDPRAISPLLYRLGECEVQADSEASDAVCRALVALDVMCSRDGSTFHFLPRRRLPDDVVDVIRELGSAIPWAYFDTSHV